MQNPCISIVVAIGRDRQHNRVIGKTNELLWHIPEDLKRFKALTMGHPVIMGHKTFESIISILGKPLPGRTNIIITRDLSIAARFHLAEKDIIFATSVKDALDRAAAIDREEIFVIGGSQIYEQALPQVDRLYLTLIDDEKEGDAYFPPYEHLFTKLIEHEHRDYEGLKYTWQTLEK